MKSVHKYALGMGAALAGLLTLAAPAGATTSTSAENQPSHATLATFKVDGDVTAQGCKVTSPWGHVGYLKCGSTATAADWNRDGRVDEVFGVADNRTIWHDWKNAGYWREMPHNGRADEMTGRYGSDSSKRWVDVRVGSTTWRSTFYSGSWHPWVRV